LHKTALRLCEGPLKEKYELDLKTTEEYDQVHAQIREEILSGRHARKIAQIIEKRDERVEVLKYIRQVTATSERGSTVGGTKFPNTDNDESTTLENEKRRISSTTSSDETIRVKIDKRYTL